MTTTKIRAARHAAKLTQAQAAKLIHTSPSNFSNWEQGHRKMSRQIWDLYQIRLAEFAVAADKSARLAAKINKAYEAGK